MKYISLVQKLRTDGIKVGVKHYRWVIERDDDLNTIPNYDEKVVLKHVTQQNLKDFSYISSNGGETHVHLTFPDGGDYEQIAVCNKIDTFCKRTGIKIAVGRILEIRKNEKQKKSDEVKEVDIETDYQKLLEEGEKAFDLQKQANRLMAQFHIKEKQELELKIKQLQEELDNLKFPKSDV